MVERAAGPTTWNAADDQKLRASHLFTSESVTEGHPDKIADQISVAVLDALLAGDPHSRVAIETLVTTGLVVVPLPDGRSGPGKTEPRASSSEDPGDRTTVFALVSVLQAVDGEVPALLSLPVTAST